MSLVSWRESGLMFKVSVRQFVSKFKQKKKRRKETCPPFFAMETGTCVKGNLLLSPWERCAAIRNPYIFFLVKKQK